MRDQLWHLKSVYSTRPGIVYITNLTPHRPRPCFLQQALLCQVPWVHVLFHKSCCAERLRHPLVYTTMLALDCFWHFSVIQRKIVVKNKSQFITINKTSRFKLISIPTFTRYLLTLTELANLQLKVSFVGWCITQRQFQSFTHEYLHDIILAIIVFKPICKAPLTNP